jgi:hypothetical protein
MTDLFLIAHTAAAVSLERRLLEKTTKLENGCWYCSAGGEESRYGTIWFKHQNIGNHVASYLVHKGSIPNGMLVCHTCDYKRCIAPDHLFLGSNQDNTDDMIRKGRKDRRVGSLNTRAILTEDQVREIKYFLEHAGMTQQAIADYFGVSRVIISQINTGKRWVHV